MQQALCGGNAHAHQQGGNHRVAWQQAPRQQPAAEQQVEQKVKEIIDSLIHMPVQMKRLALVNFITWPGLFLMWFYYSTGVASQLFHGDPLTNSDTYTMGLEHANTTSAILNLVTFGFSFSLPFLVGKLGKKLTHTACLLIGGLGLISVYYVQQPNLLYVSMGLVGIAWASILSMPYAMLSSSVNPNKMGMMMGLFNMFIVFPQIIAALGGINFMYKLLGEETINAMILAGISLIMAGFTNLFIVNKKAISG